MNHAFPAAPLPRPEVSAGARYLHAWLAVKYAAGTPKLVSQEIGLGVDRTRRLLHELVDLGVIQTDGRGLYWSDLTPQQTLAKLRSLG